jgi:hypothetical protein
MRGALGLGVMLAASLVASPPRRLAAQVPRPQPQAVNPLQRAFDLERRGSFVQAAEAYRVVLRTTPADQTALLGLERTLGAIDRVPDMLPELRAALESKPSDVIYGVGLRVWGVVGEPDSLKSLVERWAAATTDKLVPYREWGDLLLQRRDLAGARRAYQAGRAASGDPLTLSAELAQLSQMQGDWAGAAREWMVAQRLSPGYRSAAISALSQTPERSRPEVLKALGPEQGGEGTFLAAVLLAQWGEPLKGAEYLRQSVAGAAETPRGGIDLVAAFVEQVRLLGTRDARRALGQALELLAERQLAPTTSRTRLEAARAYADGGDPASARRMLALIAQDRGASGDLAAQAVRTLLEVQIAGGELPEAELTLSGQGDRIPPEDRAGLRRRLALAWMRRGELDRADALIARDSTVEGAALAGRLALLRGDLKGAGALFQQAGPYAGTRAESTERTALLALIQPIEADSLPALGAALLALERGDTAGAIAGLDRAATGLEPKGGGAQIGLLAAQLSAASGATAEAERRFKAVAATEVPATAPAAEFDLARLLLRLQRPREAVAQLEHLILTYPRSALVPQARRLLDETRGAIPAT